MPKISKQRPTVMTPDNAPVQADGMQPARMGLGIKLNVYGRGKTGKTRLVCSFPKPLLLIGTEDGTKSICTLKRPRMHLPDGNLLQSLHAGERALGIDFLRLRQSSDLDEALKLAVAHKYVTVALDHAGGLQDLIIKEVLGLEEVPVERSWGLADKQSWGIIGQQTKERLRQLLDLADRQGVNVPIVAHERNFKEDDTPSDLLAPSVGAALTPSTATWLDGAVDYICQTYLARQETEVEVQVAGETQRIKQPTGKCEYRLRIGPHPVYKTGFRTIGDELPDSIVNPSYDKIVAVIEGRQS